MEPNRKLTTEELLNADPITLTESQVTQRIALVQLRKAERECNLVEHQNQEYENTQEAKATRARAQKDSEAQMNAKLAEEKAGCAHKTGGSGYAGWFAGDGSLYGTATAVCELPTSEIYVICFRCQKTWHRPKKRDVLDGKMTLAEYFAQEKEFSDVLRWPRKTFEGINGENMAASKFTIPALIQQQMIDDREFAILVQKQQGVRC